MRLTELLLPGAVLRRSRPLPGVLTAALLLMCAVSVPASASYSLKLGIYRQPEAENLHRQLSSRGYPVYLLYGERCEVRLGSYVTVEAAKTVAEKLKFDEKLVASIVEEEDLDQSQFTWTDDGAGSPLDDARSQGFVDTRAQKIVSLGLDLFGHPYKYGGELIGKGIDCSFFVQSIFAELGICLPRTSREQYKVGVEVDKPSLKVGDLVFFQKSTSRRNTKASRASAVSALINHVGIYIGNGEFIHAMRGKMRVTISRLDERYFVQHYAGARRVLLEKAQKN